jgi:hypothetical protein
MSEIQKLSRKKILESKKEVVKKEYKKRKGIIVTIEGKDARKALAELMSNAEYDRLDVRIRIERQ